MRSVEYWLTIPRSLITVCLPSSLIVLFIIMGSSQGKPFNDYSYRIVLSIFVMNACVWLTFAPGTFLRCFCRVPDTALAMPNLFSAFNIIFIALTVVLRKNSTVAQGAERSGNVAQVDLARAEGV